MINSEPLANGVPLKDVDTSQSRYRWIMLALIWILYFAFGAVIASMAPLVTPILADLRITYSQMGIILGAWQLTYIAVAMVGGTVIDRWGIRKSLLLGVIFICLSAGLRYFANGFPFMFLCVAILGLGGPMISIGAPKTIATWFQGKERAIAVGVYMSAVAVGQLIALSLTNSVIMPLTGNSWRLTYVIFGAAVFIAAIMWGFLARDTKVEAQETSTGILRVFSTLSKVRNIRLILIMAFLSMVVSHGFTHWLPKILETGGLTPEMAGYAASVPVVAGIPSVLFITRLTPVRLRGIIVALASILSAGTLYVIAISSGGMLIAALCVFGFVFRCSLPLLILILMEQPEVGAKYMGAAGGLYFCIGEIGGFAGPSIMGAVADLTGDFFVGISLMVGLSVLMCVLALLIKPPSGASEPQ